jgi:glutathione synthase/RimK-type ligase-like ATP-grasp enzyme
MTPQFTGIARSVEFSPNHESNDAAIMRLTREAIEARGFSVSMIGEDELPTASVAAPVVFHMCQGPRSLSWLTRLEEQGKLLINSSASIRNCYRTFMLDRFNSAQVPFPRTVVVDTAIDTVPEAVADLPSLWVKRGDVHATQKGDVVHAADPREALKVLAGMRDRGIDRAVLQEHLVGDVIKFYAIHNNGFFEWYHSEGPATRPVDPEALRVEAERAADAAGLSIYGGDLVVHDKGITLIDLTDWPSVARFRERAAQKIADQIVKEARLHGRLD